MQWNMNKNFQLRFEQFSSNNFKSQTLYCFEVILFFYNYTYMKLIRNINLKLRQTEANKHAGHIQNF